MEEVQRGGQIPHLDSAVTVTRQHEPAPHKHNIYTTQKIFSPHLLGLEPILLLPSHSWTQKLVMTDPSTDLISHTRVPTEASRTVITSVSGITCNITLTITNTNQHHHHHLLHEDLLIVLVSVGPDVVAVVVDGAGQLLLQRHDLEAGAGGGAGLGGDHAAEPRDAPEHDGDSGEDTGDEDDAHQLRTWLYSLHTDTKYFSDSVTRVTGDRCTKNVWNSWGPWPTWD